MFNKKNDWSYMDLSPTFYAHLNDLEVLGLHLISDHGFYVVFFELLFNCVTYTIGQSF